MVDPGPSRLPGKPELTSDSTGDIVTASTLTSTDICALCSTPSKYTCPRCSTKTCSLACSKSHKASTGCTGERDRAAYVSMNTYTWGTLADDYVFLEDVGRNAASWGRDIVSTGRGRGGKRGRGRGNLTPKCESLRLQLATRDIGINFVAEGMEKRRLSQSKWDVRTKTTYLTVEFIFHTKDPTRKDNKLVALPLLTHRNDLTSPLMVSLSTHLKRKSDIPESIVDFMQTSHNTSQETLVIPPGVFFAVSQLERPDPNSSTPIQYQAPALSIRLTSQHTPALPSHLQNPALKPRKVFYPVDPASSLQTCLRYRSFVEWPTIDVFPSRKAFEDGRVGVLANGGAVSIMDVDEGQNKRRKTENGLVQLIGGYGEDSEPEFEGPSASASGTLGIGGLGAYASEDDEEVDNVDDAL